jgi:hypothetical protein
MDETSWNTVWLPKRVIGNIGQEQVSYDISGNPKEWFTAVGGISLAGDKLPLWIFIKGKTNRSLVKCGIHEESKLFSTETGWTSQKVLMEYIQWLSEYNDNIPIVLILDRCSVHLTDTIQKFASSKDVHLLFIPSGCTAALQPLDRRIFGELKSRAHAESARLQVQKGEFVTTYDEAIFILEFCWSRITTENIINSWNIQ